MTRSFPPPVEAIPDQPEASLSIALGIYRLTPRGGLEDHCIRIARAMQERGHRTTIFVADGEQLPDLNVRFLAKARPSWINHIRMKAFAKAFHEATRNDFDRVVGFQAIPGLDLLFWADPLRGTSQATVWRRLQPSYRGYSSLEHACFSPDSATRVMAVTEEQAHQIAAKYRSLDGRLKILPPTANISIRKPWLRTRETRDHFRTGLGIARNAPVWLWSGVQPWTKGLDRCVLALSQAPEAHLLVCGIEWNDPKMRRVRSMARRLGLTDRIHPLGYLQQESDAFIGCLAAADVLAHPARADVTGMVLLEAIVNGLPAVASEICGFGEHVTASQAGLLIPEPFDLDTFLGALTRACGPENSVFSDAGVNFGANLRLYSGIQAAVELIEAPLDQPWPSLR